MACVHEHGYPLPTLIDVQKHIVMTSLPSCLAAACKRVVMADLQARQNYCTRRTAFCATCVSTTNCCHAKCVGLAVRTVLCNLAVCCACAMASGASGSKTFRNDTTLYPWQLQTKPTLGPSRQEVCLPILLPSPGTDSPDVYFAPFFMRFQCHPSRSL
jgi:hypothetical protein